MNDFFDFLPPSEVDYPYTISEINNGIACKIESGNTLVWLEGEISNWRPSASGHCYFRLKDDKSQLPAVMWRSSLKQLNFEPCDGEAILAIASIRIYQRGGYYQLDVHRMQPLGKGTLHAAFEKLKTRLQKEGLFDDSHKRPLPSSIKTLGVITSKSGAAIRDIVRVVSSRAPQTDIILFNSSVQGEKAPAEIVHAIKSCNEYKKVDCMIVGRGGGSIEDLWAFNDENVARAIYNSQIPVISAVGHEIDFTIADFVSDFRAPTPSAAAEIAVTDNKESLRYFENLSERFLRSFNNYSIYASSRYYDLISRKALKLPVNLLMNAMQTNDTLQGRCYRSMQHHLQNLKARFSTAAMQLNALSPLSILARGYSVVKDNNNQIIKDSKYLSPGEPINIQFEKGTAQGVISKITS